MIDKVLLKVFTNSKQEIDLITQETQSTGKPKVIHVFAARECYHISEVDGVADLCVEFNPAFEMSEFINYRLLFLSVHVR